jgi:acetyl-CoA carboxylase carboxyltransferase component
MGVMEGESAVQAVHGPALDKANRAGIDPPAEVAASVDAMREDYEHQLDAKYAAARGFVDAIIHPEETAEVIALALRTALHNDGPHVGPFVLPPQPGIVR